ncbi:hypothetical protein ACEY6L_11870 [Staphylococcus aureus]
MENNIDIRPTLSNLMFKRSKEGVPITHDPLLDFNEMKVGDDLVIEFTLSNLENVINPFKRNNNITVLILIYLKNQENNYFINDLWSVELNEKEMMLSHKPFIITLGKVKERIFSDFSNTFTGIRIITLPDQIRLSESSISGWILDNQENEILHTKIPVILERL